MPDQNQPPTNPVQPPAAPAIPTPVQPEAPRPNFVAFEETAPPAPMAQASPSAIPPTGAPSMPPPPSIGGASTTSVVTSGGGSGKKIALILIAIVVILLGGVGAFMLTRQGEEQVEVTPEPSSAPIAYCSEIKAYDDTGNVLTNTQLAALLPGQTIRLAATGFSTIGTIDSVRFTVNGVQRSEVTTKVAGTDEFYDEFIIPEGTTNFDITAQVHILETDTWY
jgi:hypothetical protein